MGKQFSLNYKRGDNLVPDLNVSSYIKLVDLFSRYVKNTNRSTTEKCALASWHQFYDRTIRGRENV